MRSERKGFNSSRRDRACDYWKWNSPLTYSQLTFISFYQTFIACHISKMYFDIAADKKTNSNFDVSSCRTDSICYVRLITRAELFHDVTQQGSCRCGMKRFKQAQWEVRGA